MIENGNLKSVIKIKTEPGEIADAKPQGDTEYRKFFGNQICSETSSNDHHVLTTATYLFVLAIKSLALTLSLRG